MTRPRAVTPGKGESRPAAALLAGLCLWLAACGAPADAPDPPATGAGRGPEETREEDLERAAWHLAAGEPDAAAAVLTRLLAQEPGDARALALRARAWRRLDRPEPALVDADRLLALGRSHPDGLAVRAWALERLGRPEQAQKAYRERKQRALRHDRDSARAACRDYAEFVCDDGDLGLCERERRACAELFPDRPARPEGGDVGGVDAGGRVDSPG